MRVSPEALTVLCVIMLALGTPALFLLKGKDRRGAALTLAGIAATLVFLLLAPDALLDALAA